MGTENGIFPVPAGSFLYRPCVRKVLPVTSLADYREIRIAKTLTAGVFYPKLVTRWNISNIQNLEIEAAMVMTITEMRELKEQSSRSAGSISGKEAGGIYIRGLLCPAR